MLEGFSFKNQNFNFDSNSVSLISDIKNQSCAEVGMAEVGAVEGLLLLLSRISKKIVKSRFFEWFLVTVV